MQAVEFPCFTASSQIVRNKDGWGEYFANNSISIEIAISSISAVPRTRSVTFPHGCLHAARVHPCPHICSDAHSSAMISPQVSVCCTTMSTMSFLQRKHMG